MSGDKQISDMQNLLWCRVGVLDSDESVQIAEALYNAGYRKQSEGEWVRTDWGGKMCTCCNTPVNYMSKFCPNCGAKNEERKERKWKIIENALFAKRCTQDTQ